MSKVSYSQETGVIPVVDSTPDSTLCYPYIYIGMKVINSTDGKTYKVDAITDNGTSNPDITWVEA
jgi:hypothetical protein